MTATCFYAAVFFYLLGVAVGIHIMRRRTRERKDDGIKS
jgi:hypothetical protein